MILAIIASTWLFAIPGVILGTAALLCWLDERAWRKDEKRLALLVALEECWLLPPAERRREWN